MKEITFEEIKKLNIYEKLSLITDEIGVIEKNLKIEVTKTRSYKAVSERDVLDNVKPLEKKYRVYSYPLEREIVDKDILIKENDYGTSQSLYLRLKTTYRFVNIDKPEEYIDTIVYGDGIDTGDKAPGKAMTYADKYALMKAYKLSTGDDPDKEASPVNGYKKDDNTEQLRLLNEFNLLVIKTKTDTDKIYSYYKVKSNTEMTVAQLKEAIAQMNKKAEMEK